MHAPRLISFLSILTLTLPAAGWTLATERAMTQAALELGPPSLERLAEIHEKALEEGLRDAARHEQQSMDLHLGTDRTALERLLRREIDQAVLVMKERRPIEELVYQLGVIGHLTGDLNQPVHLGDDEKLESRRGDYEQYLERRRPRFPTVFYGIEQTRPVDRVIRRAQVRARSYEPLLRAEYFRDGQERWSRQFDDRSTAFAIASLSWSHTVSDLTNIYYELWRQAGGDVRKASRLRPGLVKGGPN